jgi:hypothetical protein
VFAVSKRDGMEVRKLVGTAATITPAGVLAAGGVS